MNLWLKHVIWTYEQLFLILFHDFITLMNFSEMKFLYIYIFYIQTCIMLGYISNDKAIPFCSCCFCWKINFLGKQIQQGSVQQFSWANMRELTAFYLWTQIEYIFSAR